MEQSFTTKENRNYALPIAIMFALFFMIAFVTGYQNPLGSVIKAKSAGDAFMSQLPTFANFIAYAFMGFPAGMLLQKKGYRITSLVAVSIGFAGVLISYMSGFIGADTTAVVVYLIGAFVSGFSMCLLNTVVNPMLNSLGKDENQGNQFVQFGGCCNSIGATLAPTVVGLLMGNVAINIADANPVFYLAMAIFAAAFFVIYFSKLPESPTLGMKQEQINPAGAFKHVNFTLGVLAIFCYVGIEVGIANLALQYMTADDSTLAVPMSVAGAIVGMYWLFMLCGRLLGGALGANVSPRAMLTFVASIALCLLLGTILLPETILVSVPGFENASGFNFIMTELPINVLLLILCGLCTSVMWGVIFNLSVSGLGKYTQVASGIFMVMVCGGGILPLIQSAIAGSVGYLNSFWLVFVLVAYLLFYALVGSRIKGGK